MKIQSAAPSRIEWLTERTTYVPSKDVRAIEAIDREGVTRGMVAYDHWAHNSVQMHVALDSPIAARSLLSAAFSYPFIMLGLGVVVGIVPASNQRSLHHALHLGFEEKHRIKDGWEVGTDLVVMEMRKENCRWI